MSTNDSPTPAPSSSSTHAYPVQGSSKTNNFFVIWLKDQSLDEKSAIFLQKSYSLLDNLGIKQEIICLDNGGTIPNNKIARLFKLIYFLDWVSYYAALLKGVYPISINNIKYIKNSIQ